MPIKKRRAKAHRFSLSSLALRHQKELGLTPALAVSLAFAAITFAVSLWITHEPRAGGPT